MRTCLLITTFNRADLLRTSLAQLMHKTLPDEILVVDDGGTDHTSDVCEEFGVEYVYTHNPEPSICSHARNVGIKATQADVIITSEPEMRFESDVIRQLLDRHEERPLEVISAGTIHHQQPDGHTIRTLQGWVAPFVALYERQWLMEIGGWDEGFPSPWGWEDTDLLTRLRWGGYGQYIDLEIEATHLFHDSRACDQGPNESRFLAKINPDDIVANRGVPWGTLKTI